MTLAAAVVGLQPGSLSELVDAVALRTGAWVVVERLGCVVTHGAGRAACPPSLTSALVTKTTAPLRAEASWTRGGRRLQGTLDGRSVCVVDLGEGAAAWFLDGDVEEATLPLVEALLHEDARPVHDPLLEALLHPRGPARSGRAPRAELVVLTSAGPLPALARAVMAVASGTEARVHAEPDSVVVALPPGGDVEALCGLVRQRCPGATAGAASVPEAATDWAETAGLAAASERAARELGLPVGHVSAPAVAAELVIEHARQGVEQLLRTSSVTPLALLAEYDTRTSAYLVRTLTTWCAHGFDAAAAAAALHLHTNTLRYRLRRAGEISGLDLTNARQLLALRLLLLA